MTIVSFKTWISNHSSIEKLFIDREGKNCRWSRIQIQWIEKIGNTQTLTHQYAFTVDRESGALYIDCRKRKIWVKFAFLCLGRPIFGISRTIYHLFLPVSIPCEIYRSIEEGKNKSLTSREIKNLSLKYIKESLFDIFRCPLYTLAMTILSLAAVIFGPFAPLKLYDLREIAGNLERKLNRENDSKDLTPCFQPIDHLMTIEDEDYSSPDTFYDPSWDPTLKGLSNVARALIKHRRKTSNPFDDCGVLLPKDKLFISAAIV